MIAPPCPITGAPGSELIEEISPKLLRDLWRFGARVEPAPLTPTSPRIGLWRSPAGLWFFHPAEAGSAAFYRTFYQRFGAYELFARQARNRADFRAAAAAIPAGARVLDIGCGDGAFAALIPQTRYTGLDPHATAPKDGPLVLAESLADHAARCPAAYDVVCGLQVIEHVADPLRLAADMVRCLRPGGLLVLAMPRFGSPLNRVPNCLLNLPPHHLSWWTEPAALALCAALGLVPEQVAPLAPGRTDAIAGWIAKLCPERYRPGRFVRPGLGCHLAMLLGFQFARRFGLMLGVPRGTPPVDLLVIARRPPAV